MNRGFSFASVILSYFLVGGGLFTGTLLTGMLKVESELVAYALMAAGAFAGGFVAARASRGSTVLEPAIGAVAVVATIVGLAAGTEFGQMIWRLEQDQTMKFIGAVGATSMGGAIAGAFVSEKVFGDATQSSLPWILYTAMSVFGASLLAIIFASLLFVGSHTVEGHFEELGMMMLVGIGAGCLLAGLAVGASARSRPLIAGFVGGGLGVTGFFLLISRASPAGLDDQAAAGIAVLAGGGAIASLIGTLIGWVAVGRNHAA